MHGVDAIWIYDSFEFAAATAPIEADEESGQPAVPGRPAEDRHDLETVMRKFDKHWGTGTFRSMKRQSFLDIKRQDNESIMDFIAKLKREAEHCAFGDMRDSFIETRL